MAEGIAEVAGGVGGSAEVVLSERVGELVGCGFIERLGGVFEVFEDVFLFG